MDEQKSESDNRPSQRQLLQEANVRCMLPPPNPILNRQIQKIDQKVNFRLQPWKQFREQEIPKNNPNQPKKIPVFEEDHKKQPKISKTMLKMTLTNGYQPSTMIFMKYENKNCNKRGKCEYFSSLFLKTDNKESIKLPNYKGMIAEDDLIFDSNYQSANLMAVFKVDKNTYDLVLQNDVNTRCFTQWFNFKVQNKRNNFIAKFNIVNLYKSKSLYNNGMKPIVRSQLSQKLSKKSWRRRGFNIFYEKNELHYQDDETKFYKTLTFQYDFTLQNDTVHFAHGLPYDISDLKKFLQNIKVNQKVNLYTIGSTLMGKSIPLIKISTPEAYQKKVLIILGRQHPGETPGSFIAEQMVSQMLKNTNETDFLLSRFDIYIFPMVNIDGVALGNYRGNFAGFDLNRCWLKPDPSKQPEINIIKNYIKKIAKKQQIELILDLHGHSRKMGSFFYGNDFGSNFMLFPFISSKINRNILFEHSKFTRQTQNDPKFSTARVVLGNMIKDTGYVYTYEVSFYGYYKENSEIPFSFTQQHYKQLGRSLVTSIYRTFLQIQKQQKSLKESIYLRNIKRQLSQFTQDGQKQNRQSGSDSEAEAEMAKEILLIQQFLALSQKIEQNQRRSLKLNDQDYPKINDKKNSDKIRSLGSPVQIYNPQIKRKIQQLLQKNMQNDLRDVIAQRLPHLIQNQIKRHIKSQKIKVEDENDASLMEIQKIQEKFKDGSSLSQKNVPMNYMQQLKLRRQKKKIEQSLKMSGATLELLGTSKKLQSTQTSTHNKYKKKYLDKGQIFSNNSIQLSPVKQDDAMKSFHTIDLKGYMYIDKQSKDKSNQKLRLQMRKKNPGFVFRHNEISEINIGNRSIDLDVVAQSLLKINRSELKNKEIRLPQIKIMQRKTNSGIKLPLI